MYKYILEITGETSPTEDDYDYEDFEYKRRIDGLKDSVETLLKDHGFNLVYFNLDQYEYDKDHEE